MSKALLGHPAHSNEPARLTNHRHSSEQSHFWRRNYAIPALGFQNFSDITTFSAVEHLWRRATLIRSLGSDIPRCAATILRVVQMQEKHDKACAR